MQNVRDAVIGWDTVSICSNVAQSDALYGVSIDAVEGDPVLEHRARLDSYGAVG